MSETYPFHEYADLFPLLNSEEIGELAADILRNGLREPIVLYEGKILDGRNRYLACREAGVEPRFEPYTGDDPLGFVRSMNEYRRHLTSSQRAAVAVLWAGLEDEQRKARERRLAQLKQGDKTPVRETIPERENGRVRDKAAELFGTNGRYVFNAKRLQEKEPELFERVRSGSITLPKAMTALKTKETLASVTAYTEAVKEAPALEKVYNVLYADPPWDYGYKNPEGVNIASKHYHTMSLEDICAFLEQTGVQVADDAVLFLWTTNPFLQKALEVVAAWQFRYKTNIAWVKTNRKRPGAGHYVRGQHELLFICTRGQFTPLDKHLSPPVGSVLMADQREHSEKPSEVYELIERLYPGCTYIELFARTQRDGWEAIGNEIR